MDDARFSVFHIVQDDTYRSIRQNVSVDVAVELFAQGIDDSKHVIVTDGQTSLTWQYGKGLSR